ncbi:MAG: glutathione S-transferase family protein [Gammaproteobacteria bacterium]|nr:MAG: glutathione S-transferase family protein [Gammaproteobacteria bacterium]
MARILYGYPGSRSTRVAWMLEELGLDYRFVRVDLSSGQHRSEAFLRLNPGGKVPVLEEDGFLLTESVAICTWLGDSHPESGLVPRCGTHERALYDSWTCFILSELEQPLWNMAKHRFALPEEYRLEGMKRTALWEFARALKALEAGLDGRPCLVGEDFTAADLLATATLNWALANKVPVESPAIRAYLRRHTARPALARAREREEQGEPFA